MGSKVAYVCNCDQPHQAAPSRGWGSLCSPWQAGRASSCCLGPWQVQSRTSVGGWFAFAYDGRGRASFQVLGSTLYSLCLYFYWVLVFPFLYFLSVSESRPFAIRAANTFFVFCHLSAAFVSGSFVL